MLVSCHIYFPWATPLTRALTDYKQDSIPTSVCLTVFSSAKEFMATPLEDIARQVACGSIQFPIKTYTLDQIGQAHQDMEESNLMAKAVVLLDH